MNEKYLLWLWGTYSMEEQRTQRARKQINARSPNSIYILIIALKTYFLSYSSCELYRKSYNPQVHFYIGSNSRCTCIKITKTADMKVETNPLKEFCPVFRIFGSKRRHAQTVHHLFATQTPSMWFSHIYSIPSASCEEEKGSNEPYY